MQMIGLVVFVLFLVAVFSRRARAWLLQLALMAFLLWAALGAAHTAARDLPRALLARFLNDVNSAFGALSTALSVVASTIGYAVVGTAVGASIVSGVLDIVEFIVRLYNVAVRKDTSLANLAGAFASSLDAIAKAVIVAGLTGGGPVVTGVGLGLAVMAEAVKVVILHTNSLNLMTLRNRVQKARREILQILTIILTRLGRRWLPGHA